MLQLKREYRIMFDFMKQERESYINIDCTTRNLDFWGKYFVRYLSQFMHLLKIVDILITAQVNSASNERIFSQRKHIMNDKRNRIEYDTVEWLLRIKNNSVNIKDETCTKLYQDALSFYCNDI